MASNLVFGVGEIRNGGESPSLLSYHTQVADLSGSNICASRKGSPGLLNIFSSLFIVTTHINTHHVMLLLLARPI